VLVACRKSKDQDQLLNESMLVRLPKALRRGLYRVLELLLKYELPCN
jgi:hypothetical protein